mmetsp:Transcript_12779/g.31022  ORF Transcript_12779/g.31022 Transcript_12779/m.31022 type:complete len:284 (-) Transcript_12779:145-996(-)
MKFGTATLGFFVAATTTTSVSALQGNYLSQLTPNTVSSQPSSTSPSTPPGSSSSFFPEPSTTVGQNSGGTMESLYSSGPAAGSAISGSDTITPAFGLSPPQFSSSSSGSSAVVPSQQLLQAWSAQVSVELSASQLYLSASIWCRSQGYPGMAAWMLDESGEERGHGLAILEWALQHGWATDVVLEPLDAPKRDWNSIVEVWQSILQAEQTNTQNLLRLASYANDCGDYGSQAFLNPFHTEQIDAEDKVGSILHKVSMATPEFLVELDHQLGIDAEEEAAQHGH